MVLLYTHMEMMHARAPLMLLMTEHFLLLHSKNIQPVNHEVGFNCEAAKATSFSSIPAHRSLNKCVWFVRTATCNQGKQGFTAPCCCVENYSSLYLSNYCRNHRCYSFSYTYITIKSFTSPYYRISSLLIQPISYYFIIIYIS